MATWSTDPPRPNKEIRAVGAWRGARNGIAGRASASAAARTGVVAEMRMGGELDVRRWDRISSKNAPLRESRGSVVRESLCQLFKGLHILRNYFRSDAPYTGIQTIHRTQSHKSHHTKRGVETFCSVTK